MKTQSLGTTFIIGGINSDANDARHMCECWTIVIVNLGRRPYRLTISFRFVCHLLIMRQMATPFFLWRVSFVMYKLLVATGLTVMILSITSQPPGPASAPSYCHIRLVHCALITKQLFLYSNCIPVICGVLPVCWFINVLDIETFNRK